METVSDFILGAPKSLQMVIAAMKLRHLLVGGKVMTNLDSITLPTMARLVKAMVFPVLMDECESWTVKKAKAEELMLWNCGLEKPLESPLVHHKGDQS